MSSPDAEPAAEGQAFGPFDLRVEAEAIAAYGQAAGARGPTPFVFPVALLAAPAAQAALAALIGPDFAAVHEAQSFEAEQPLEPGVYILSGAARRAHAPERLKIETQVAGRDGACVARMTTTLRLFPLNGARA